MPIVASAIVERAPQRDGRMSVREQHTDHLGVNYFAAWLADNGMNLMQILLNRAAQISADLTAGEIAANISAVLANPVNASPSFNYSTVNQNLNAIRAIYATLTSWQVCCLGRYFNGLNLTDTQLKNIFNVNDAQLPALKTRLANQAADYDAAAAQTGQ